jgi:hypothetical protein
MSDKKALKVLIDELKERGVRGLTVEFSGGGDEGSINEITFEPNEPAGYQSGPLEDALNDYLTDQGDWWNNDGGGGTLKVDVATGKLDLDIYFNEIKENHERRKETL